MLVWDATCPDTLVPSYPTLTVSEAGEVADEAERKKKVKYAYLNISHHFVPVVVETLGSLGPKLAPFLKNWLVT